MKACCFCLLVGEQLGYSVGIVNGNWTGPQCKIGGLVAGTWAPFHRRAGGNSVQQDDGRILRGIPHIHHMMGGHRYERRAAVHHEGLKNLSLGLHNDGDPSSVTAG